MKTDESIAGHINGFCTSKYWKLIQIFDLYQISYMVGPGSVAIKQRSLFQASRGRGRGNFFEQKQQTSSPKGNDAHLRAIIQREKKWKHQFFRRLRAASSVVRGRIWPNFKLIEALMYVIITCKYVKDPIKNNREKVATLFFKYNTICCHGNQW